MVCKQSLAHIKALLLFFGLSFKFFLWIFFDCPFGIITVQCQLIGVYSQSLFLLETVLVI